MTESKQILLGVCGSIAAYRAADLVRSFQKAGVGVTVVMTLAAREFVAPLTFEALSRRRVWSDLFSSEEADKGMTHIRLARESDAVVVAPATADILGKWAAGIADSLLGCLLLVARKPIFVAPAMNTSLWHHPAVQANVEKIRSWGVHFILPTEGDLACGEHGEGHLADGDVIVNEVMRGLNET